MKRIVFSLPGNKSLGASIAEHLSAEVGQSVVRSFPDGETYIRIQSDVRDLCVVLVATLDRPDAKLLPLYFMARTARDLGARCICLVAPYLAYMRQDTRFHPGEGITSEYFGQLISGFADRLITVDPHLHRRSSLEEVYSIPSRVIHAAPHIAGWIRENVRNPLLIGPDEESGQWVSDVASRAGSPFVVLKKERRGDRNVEVSVPDVDRWKDHTPVLVDDIISTARTMIETVMHVRDAGMKPPICIGVHAVFAGDSYGNLLGSGVAAVVTCNTVPHASNGIDVSVHLAEAVGEFADAGGER